MGKGMAKRATAEDPAMAEPITHGAIERERSITVVPPAASHENGPWSGHVVAERYELGRLLGSGSTASVYAGEHLWTRRRVAVKVLHAKHAANQRTARRWMREARTLASLEHPNVVSVLDMDVDPSVGGFVVLERLEGETLAESLRRVGRLSGDEAVYCLEPILGALAEAHRCSIVHQELKPENILLAQTPSGVVPKLLDFGIA
ncbi:MAG: serine/threonine protein kinase, partial [Myxococcales bacterium]|nr:serine/threonine protein kinase [Myxococcales bacterium]